MSRILHRLGYATAAHPWRTICAWIALVVIAFGLAGAFGGTTRDDYDVPDARAQVGVDQLRAHVPDGGGATAQVVVHDREGDPLAGADLDALVERLAALDHVSVVSPPRLSADGDTALVSLAYDAPVTEPDLVGAKGYDPLEQAIEPLREAGIQAELGGELPGGAESQMTGTGELAGIIAALVLLVVAFGSVVAAGLPLAIALTGLGVGTAGVTLLAATMDVSTAAPTVATMVGLGVGIDYALLLVNRHVEFLRQGLDKREAAARAMATAGRSVVFASLTVLISLMGLKLGGLAVYATFGYATAIAVVSVLAAALTLVPALCGLAGGRLLPRKVRKGAAARVAKTPLTARWARRVTRRPVAFGLAALVFLLFLAAPVLGMRTWPQDGSSASPDTSQRKAYDLIADEYGAGANGPFTFVVETGTADAAAVAAQVAATDGVEVVGTPFTSPDGELAIFDMEPTYGPSDERTSELLSDLRAEMPEGVEITGTTPIFADISGMLSERLWLVVGFVVSVSVLLLAMMFRSVVVPIKAAAMNLLSIAASYGVLVAIFQWGWGGSVLGIDHAVAVSSWIPILNFAILFGLSMDYEVFLLSRIREDWLRTGDATGSVERGLAATGRVISSAAAIMVVVFLGFSTEADTVVKQLGLGMAIAIVLDATVVRMVLVPSTMTLLGRWNWWIPAWLDRLLPAIRAEVDETDAIWAELDTTDARADDDKVGV
ncbi:MMPL family transporter [Nocardioides sp. MAH-18]|uniref:MMPL family transporter n=1 Tax=Nocardioides agri TaxID=2682843 RepID=A0A6L6XWN5_9ACTN|nr:MMPL family transporter [Nocardioides sp. CGMCC 1.13656]MBA2952457.1 MMPL family transporter [Nocardioides sp. CGMCC 1.13656]MVQ51619.1 MMPL family transporter [Nocardioides sp. MAH-18]